MIPNIHTHQLYFRPTHKDGRFGSLPPFYVLGLSVTHLFWHSYTWPITFCCQAQIFMFYPDTGEIWPISQILLTSLTILHLVHKKINSQTEEQQQQWLKHSPLTYSWEQGKREGRLLFWNPCQNNKIMAIKLPPVYFWLGRSAQNPSAFNFPMKSYQFIHI